MARKRASSRASAKTPRTSASTIEDLIEAGYDVEESLEQGEGNCTYAIRGHGIELLYVAETDKTSIHLLLLAATRTP